MVGSNFRHVSKMLLSSFAINLRKISFVGFWFSSITAQRARRMDLRWPPFSVASDASSSMVVIMLSSGNERVEWLGVSCGCLSVGCGVERWVERGVKEGDEWIRFGLVVGEVCALRLW